VVEIASFCTLNWARPVLISVVKTFKIGDKLIRILPVIELNGLDRKNNFNLVHTSLVFHTAADK
jgi:hypothetical protein